MSDVLALTAVTGSLLLISRYCAHLVMTGGRRIPLSVRPEDLGLPYEKADFNAQDGVALRGWFIPAGFPSRRTLLLCHGWGGNKGEILKFTHPLRDRGFNLLYFDFRLCGESGGKLSSVGCLEAMDFDAAIGFLISKRPQDSLGVYGLSMGAMVALAGVTRHPRIKAAVLESPFASHDQAVARYAWTTRNIPYYPLLPLVFFWIRLRLGRDPDLNSPEKLAPLIKGVPILMINGELDASATPAIGSGLLQKIQGHKEHWIVTGARHARCAEVSGRIYQDRLEEFYDRHL